MKILLINQAKKHFTQQETGRWHFLPYYFEKQGHKVLHLTKRHAKWFLFYYLKFKPDVIISVGLIGIVPILFKKLGFVKVPIVHDWNDYYEEIFARKIGADKAAFLEKYVIINSDFITTPSKYLKEKAEIFGKGAELIPHGVELNLNLRPAKLKGRIKLIYIGEQTPYKRVDRIVKAVRGLDCELYIAGPPNTDLKKKASRNVHFLGKIPHEKISTYIKAADICIITADQENLKMYEYAKVGKPILAYKGRIQYVLTHLENAYLCEDFRQGLKSLMFNKKLMKKLQKNIKKLKTYSWKEIARKYIRFLKKVKKVR